MITDAVSTAVQVNWRVH